MEKKMFGVKIPPPVITKEHGSWAVLLVPILVNACVAGKWSIDFVFVALAVLGVFLSYVPAQVLLRHYSGVPQRDERVRQAKFWITGYLFVTIGSAVPLLVKGYIFLLVIGSIGAVFFFCNFFLVKHYSKMIATDLIAVAGLTLSGPSVYYVLTGMLDRTAVSLYVLNFLFFGCSVFYVHMKIQFSASKKAVMAWRENLKFGKLNLLYFAAVVSIMAILAASRFTSIIALVAFVPMIAHGVYGTVNLSSRVHFKNLGFLLLGQSILFGTLLSYFCWK